MSDDGSKHVYDRDSLIEGARAVYQRLRPAALPMPAAVRPGTTWTIERERDWTTEPCESLACDGDRHRCDRPIVARRWDHRFHSCEIHLRSGLMWLEDGLIVSWRLQAEGDGT